MAEKRAEKRKDKVVKDIKTKDNPHQRFSPFAKWERSMERSNVNFKKETETIYPLYAVEKPKGGAKHNEVNLKQRLTLDIQEALDKREEMDIKFAEQMKELEIAKAQFHDSENLNLQQKILKLQKETEIEAERKKKEAQLMKEREHEKDRAMELLREKKEEELLSNEIKIEEQLRQNKAFYASQMKKEEEEALKELIAEQAKSDAVLKEQKRLMNIELQRVKVKQAADFAEKEMHVLADTERWKKGLKERQEEQDIQDMIEENELKMELFLQLETSRKEAKESLRQYERSKKN